MTTTNVKRCGTIRSSCDLESKRRSLHDRSTSYRGQCGLHLLATATRPYPPPSPPCPAPVQDPADTRKVSERVHAKSPTTLCHQPAPSRFGCWTGSIGHCSCSSNLPQPVHPRLPRVPSFNADDSADANVARCRCIIFGTRWLKIGNRVCR